MKESIRPRSSRHRALSAGLPEGYQGNSEVGHLNIGAGRIVYQSLTRIDKSIADGDFSPNAAFLKAINHAKANRSALPPHGSHSGRRRACGDPALHRLLELCKNGKVTNVLIHAITDGRDTPPKSAMEQLAFCKRASKKPASGGSSTVIGRYYAMDRETAGTAPSGPTARHVRRRRRRSSDWREAVRAAYAAGENDEFIKPLLIDYTAWLGNDAFIFFNFRFDRTRQLTKAMVEPEFKEFERRFGDNAFVAMTHYYDNGQFDEAYPEAENKNILGEVLAGAGLKQFRCAETEKYAHVTFFFNALRNEPFEGEDRVLVESPKVATYDLKPEMSAFEVRDKLVAAIDSRKYDVVICNFANGDMVGHTGVFDAIIKAVETVDTCVHDVVEAASSKAARAFSAPTTATPNRRNFPTARP